MTPLLLLHLEDLSDVHEEAVTQRSSAETRPTRYRAVMLLLLEDAADMRRCSGNAEVEHGDQDVTGAR
jgi:hypothetical protein